MNPLEEERQLMLRGILRERVSIAALRLVQLAAGLAADPDPEGGPVAATVAIRNQLAVLIDAAAFADVHLGRSTEEIADSLGLGPLTIERRYGRTPPNLPLRVILTGLDPLDGAPRSLPPEQGDSHA